MITCLGVIDARRLLEEYELIEEKIVWADGLHKGKQSGLQYSIGEDIWLSATGKSKNWGIKHDQLNPFYQGTFFENLIKEYKMIRSRFMWLGGSACYSFHLDRSQRIHVPIITNPQSFLIWRDGQIHHLETGYVYLVDTTKEHTAMNGADIPRLHLVGEIPN